MTNQFLCTSTSIPNGLTTGCTRRHTFKLAAASIRSLLVSWANPCFIASELNFAGVSFILLEILTE